MKYLWLGLFAFAALTVSTSCAPVKFTKSSTTAVNPNVTSLSGITCDPKINGNLSTFTYASLTSNFPSISPNCSPSDGDYTWTVKRADGTIINTAIPGLSGAAPADINFGVLGQGNYYVFLTNAKTNSGLSPYVAATPLEFIIPGPGVTNILTCDPKLNSTLTSVAIGQSDNNPVVTANCNPSASTYSWTVTKDGQPFALQGLSGAQSTPNIKSYGAGVYRLSLYSMLTGSNHWQSTDPLVVTVTGNPVPSLSIECNPRINGSLTNLVLTSASANPLISGNCMPANVQYSWTVTKNGVTQSVPGLAGANSNPDFLSLGRGHYIVYLTASSPGYNSWTTTTPLELTVDENTNNLTLDCAPRLNNTNVAVTIAQNGTNPLVTAGCNPSNVQYTWSVFRGGSAVNIAGLSGSNSIGNFIQSGLGTYFIYLTASSPGYNTYVSPSPLEVTVAPVETPVRDVTFTKLVQITDNKVDILVVFDDSNSMLPDSTKLAQKLSGFISDLSSAGVDWQMCATITREQFIASRNASYWGASKNWYNYPGDSSGDRYVLKNDAVDPYNIFTETVTRIGAGHAGTDDERGIKAAIAQIGYLNKCHRTDASLAVILISDEDERSVGGNKALEYYSGEMKPLEEDDQPQTFVNKVKQLYGNNKRFTFNSIIVKPGDTTCYNQQKADPTGVPHYGYKYAELSQLTSGGVGSICANDYSQNLYYFKDRIVNTLSSVPLECAPVGAVNITVTPAMSPAVVGQLQNNSLVLNPAVPAGRTIEVKYKCPRN